MSLGDNLTVQRCTWCPSPCTPHPEHWPLCWATGSCDTGQGIWRHYRFTQGPGRFGCSKSPLGVLSFGVGCHSNLQEALVAMC